VFMEPGIYQLNLSKNFEITVHEKVALPPKVRLFDFTYANLDGAGSYEIVAIDSMEKMRIYNSSNELLWVSKRNFGGSSVYLGPSQGSAVNDSERWGLTVDEEAEREPIFVPNPMMVRDVDKNGRQELIVNENKSVGFGSFHKLRIYKSSEIVSLRWNGESMEEVWRSGEHKGVISAYSFTTMQSKNVKGLSGAGNKSTGRLYIVYVPKKGTLLDLLPGSLDSELKMYELEFTNIAVKK